VKANVGGSEPESVRDAVGVPVVVTVKENASPVMAVAEDALVKRGAVPPSSATAGTLERPLKAKRPAPKAIADKATSHRRGRTSLRAA
jgi:hypothetical protein